MNAVSMIVSLANRLGIVSRLWVAGGFLTEDENPSDCMIILVVDERALEALDEDQREFFNWFRDVPLYEKYGCRNYAVVLDAARPEHHRLCQFWLRQLGFHAETGTGGVAEFLTPGDGA